jgi:hypothetical protein
MAEETGFVMGAKASCADGPGGKVIRVIIIPAAKTVTHLVIEPVHRVVSGGCTAARSIRTTTG